MFEKEAEEYFRENAYNFDELTACRECMEFGYNKARELLFRHKRMVYYLQNYRLERNCTSKEE